MIKEDNKSSHLKITSIKKKPIEVNKLYFLKQTKPRIKILSTLLYSSLNHVIGKLYFIVMNEYLIEEG